MAAKDQREQRRSRRFKQELLVELVDRRGVRQLRAVDVARHGLLLATDEQMRERHLVQLIVYLPGGPVKVAASVARRAQETPDGPCVGVEFFALSDDAKQRWDDFIFAVSRTTPPRGVPRPDLSGGEQPARSEPAGATFLVRLKTLDRLRDFQRTHLASGGTVLFTPVLRVPGEVVTLIVVHPATDEEFRLPGLVAKAHEDRPKRLDIHFPGVNPQVLNAFAAFVESGRPPQVVMRAPVPVPSAAAEAARELELDVDVFDEDTLDTDERVLAMHKRLSGSGPPLGPAQSPARDELLAPPTTPPQIAPLVPAVDPGLRPTAVLLRCDGADCTAEPYAVDLGPCRGVLGLVADHVPFISSDSGRVVSVPRLVSNEERQRRVQEFLLHGGRLDAVVDLMTLLGAVALSEPPRDPESGVALKSGRSVERLEAAARHQVLGGAPSRTKVACPQCRHGNLTVEIVTV